MYTTLLGAALDQFEHSDPPPTLGDQFAHLLGCRVGLIDARPPTAPGTGCLDDLTNRLAYDASLVGLARRLGFEVTVEQFGDSERRHLEQVLIDLGLPFDQFEVATDSGRRGRPANGSLDPVSTDSVAPWWNYPVPEEPTMPTNATSNVDGEHSTAGGRGTAETVDRTLVRWRARIDELKVQVDLATLDVREDLSARIEVAENVYLAIRSRLSDARSDGGKASTSVRQSIDQLLVDLRRAYDDAEAVVKRSHQA